jgi:hypothetical protein
MELTADVHVVPRRLLTASLTRQYSNTPILQFHIFILKAAGFFLYNFVQFSAKVPKSYAEESYSKRTRKNYLVPLAAGLLRMTS